MYVCQSACRFSRLYKKAGSALPLIRQLTSFSLIGISATFAHVALAYVLMESAKVDLFLANLMGAGCAYLVSFIGNVTLTFSARSNLALAAAKYGLVSLFSACLSSIILFATTKLGLPNYAYVFLVLLFIPPMTFALAKWWVFRKCDSHSNHSA